MTSTSSAKANRIADLRSTFNDYKAAARDSPVRVQLKRRIQELQEDLHIPFDATELD